SKVTRSPESQMSRTSSSGSSTPRTCRAIHKGLQHGRERAGDHPVPGGVGVDVPRRTHPGPLAAPAGAAKSPDPINAATMTQRIRRTIPSSYAGLLLLGSLEFAEVQLRRLEPGARVERARV